MTCSHNFWFRGAQEIEWVRWKGTYVLNHLPESLAHCLQVQRQKANIKTGFTSQWPLLAQPLQDELWSLHPLCITRDKEIITKLLMPMQLEAKTNHEGRWKYNRNEDELGPLTTVSKTSRSYTVKGQHYWLLFVKGLDNISPVIVEQNLQHLTQILSRGPKVTFSCEPSGPSGRD